MPYFLCFIRNIWKEKLIRLRRSLYLCWNQFRMELPFTFCLKNRKKRQDLRRAIRWIIMLLWFQPKIWVINVLQMRNLRTKSLNRLKNIKWIQAKLFLINMLSRKNKNSLCLLITLLSLPFWSFFLEFLDKWVLKLVKDLARTPISIFKVSPRVNDFHKKLTSNLMMSSECKEQNKKLLNLLIF